MISEALRVEYALAGYAIDILHHGLWSIWHEGRTDVLSVGTVVRRPGEFGGNIYRATPFLGTPIREGVDHPTIEAAFGWLLAQLVASRCPVT